MSRADAIELAAFAFAGVALILYAIRTLPL